MLDCIRAATSIGYREMLCKSTIDRQHPDIIPKLVIKKRCKAANKTTIEESITKPAEALQTHQTLLLLEQKKRTKLAGIVVVRIEKTISDTKKQIINKINRTYDILLSFHQAEVLRTD